MTTEEQFQSSEIQPVNGGTEDVHANDHDDETSTVTSPSSQPVRRSRFFRSKRKQRLGQTGGGDEENEHASNEPITSPTSPEDEEEEEQIKTTSEISTDDTDSRVETHVHKRSLSPPPPPPLQDDADNPGDTSSSSEDINAKCSVYPIRKFTPAKVLPAQPRPSLPTIHSDAIDNRIYGTVKVVSFGINKRVKIRLTTNNWVTFTDHETTYISDSYDGINDRFTFTIEIPRDRICIGNNLQFCIGYESFVGPEYWDNNYQENYRFECTSRSIPDYSG